MDQRRAPQRFDFPRAMNGGFRPATTALRCPKCRKRDLSLTESIEATTSWYVNGGLLNREDGIHELGGFIGRLSAQCAHCDHRWHPRGATMITDVVTELDPQTLEPVEP